jgi:hypothetical protein
MRPRGDERQQRLHGQVGPHGGRDAGRRPAGAEEEQGIGEGRGVAAAPAEAQGDPGARDPIAHRQRREQGDEGRHRHGRARQDEDAEGEGRRATRDVRPGSACEAMPHAVRAGPGCRMEIEWAPDRAPRVA